MILILNYILYLVKRKQNNQKLKRGKCSQTIARRNRFHSTLRSFYIIFIFIYYYFLLLVDHLDIFSSTMVVNRI